MSKRSRVKLRGHEDFLVDGLWRKSKQKLNQSTGYTETILSLSGARWMDMNSRCKSGGSRQKNYPSYIGTTNSFESFQNFVEWSIKQFGYNEFELFNGRNQPWCLDKDLLGGMCYSEETCLFVPSEVNLFLTYKQNRGSNLTGVKQLPSGRYESRISFRGQYKYLGVFYTEQEAHNAWRKEKASQSILLSNKFNTLGHMTLAEALYMLSKDLTEPL